MLAGRLSHPRKPKALSCTIFNGTLAFSLKASEGTHQSLRQKMLVPRPSGAPFGLSCMRRRGLLARSDRSHEDAPIIRLLSSGVARSDVLSWQDPLVKKDNFRE